MDERKERKTPIRILIACGTGMMCSTIVHMELERLLQEEINQYTFTQCPFQEIPQYIDTHDLLVLASSIDQTYPIKTIVVYEYLTEDNHEEADKRVSEAIKEIKE